jgi:hypothetical protein
MKDVGGIVRDYQAQTFLYRLTDREVRIHECHSACTLALSLPNVCVYPDSIFKFHQAYNMHNHQTDLNVSAQLFDTYPAAVRARLGPLTRQFKILSGAELIALGVRDCNTPRVMLARAHPASPDDSGAGLSTAVTSVMSVFGRQEQQEGAATHKPQLVATRQEPEAQKNLPAEALSASVPLPPPRPELATPLLAQPVQNLAAHLTEAPSLVTVDVPLPPPRPTSLATRLAQTMPQMILPQVIKGAQPILPPQFLAYAMIARAQPFGRP